MLGGLRTRCSVSLLRAEGSGSRTQTGTERAQHRHEKGLRDKAEGGRESRGQRAEERENLQPLEIVWAWCSRPNYILENSECLPDW